MLDGNTPAASAIGQEVASAALCNLAADENNRAEIAAAGAIPLFVHLVLHGTAPGGGEYSAHALGSLACHNPITALAIIQVSKIRLPPGTCHLTAPTPVHKPSHPLPL